MRVLVGYATTHGSTREIADRIAARLNEAGLVAEARPMAAVDDAYAYGAYVLGSAVHGQSWLDPAKDFVRTNADILRSRPVWIFSVGMPAALRGFWKRLGPKELPVIARRLPADLSVREHRLFSGVISRDHIPVIGRLAFHLLGGRFGDYRDWVAIEAWAKNIAHELTVG